MNLKFMRRVSERERAIRQFVIVKNKLMSVFNASVLGLTMLRPFATNDRMVQNPPYWRASSLLFPHCDIKTKASHA